MNANHYYSLAKIRIPEAKTSRILKRIQFQEIMSIFRKSELPSFPVPITAP